MKKDTYREKIEPGRLFEDEPLRRAFAVFIARELRDRDAVDVPRSGISHIKSATVSKKQPQRDATVVTVHCVAHDDDCTQTDPKVVRIISDERTFEITVKEVARNF